jgi:hypothetical protein
VVELANDALPLAMEEVDEGLKQVGEIVFGHPSRKKL